MEKPNRSSYTPLDFQGWQASGGLNLAPMFQRRGVWTTPARSYLIDTLMQGLPVPPIYLRVTQDKSKKKVIREVVDGQQRISAVLDFLEDKYALSKSLSGPYAGKVFSQLPEAAKDAIKMYSFFCEVFHGATDAEILQVFARLNTYSIPLNAQELRNGTFFGRFRQAVYGLAFEHVTFWRRHQLFSERSIARMAEVELTSELVIASLDGMQDKKKSIDDFYARFDDAFPQRKQVEERFRATIDTIDSALGETLEESEFRRAPMMYTLYCVVFHRVYGLPKQKGGAKGAVSRPDQTRLRDAVVRLSDLVARQKANEAVPAKYVPFVTACLRQTDNIRPRQARFNVLYAEAFE